MSLGQRIAAKRQSNRSMIEVAEWGDDAPLAIYTGSLTCADVDRLQRKHKDFMSNPTVAAMVDLLIMKAEDKDGEKLFISLIHSDTAGFFRDLVDSHSYKLAKDMH